MPDVQRTVSTLLKVDGEQQYKAAIANINREQQALKANIRLVDEQFKGQANTMSALIAKEKLYADQQSLSNQKLTAAQGMYAKAEAAVKKYADEIVKLKNYVAKDTEEQEKLKKQLETANENFLKAQNSVVYYSKSVTNAQIEVAKINNSIKDNAKYLNEAKNSANGTASSIDAYGKQVKTAKENTEEFGKNGSEAFKSLAQALVAAGLIRSVGELVDLFKEAVKASNSFETAFTGVTKTVEGSPAQLDAIKEQMKALSTEIPLTADELAKIAQIAGQLGIATDDISSFTETIAALTVSTNLSADQAATQLARFAKITGMQASEYDNLGAVIVALGNTSAATESEIVDMGMGIAAAGKQVGMTQPQIMAFAAALTSAGLDSQAGGTAISRTLVEMSMAAEVGGEALDKFANVAGMSSEAFASAFKTSAADALNTFITGLASGSESAIKALNDMGITEIRQRDAILRLANAGDTLTNSINTANTAFAENTALAEESAKFYATTDSKIQLLKNSVNLLAITIGDQYNPAVRGSVRTLTEWTDSINEFLKENPTAVQAITGFATALGVLALAVGGYVVYTQIAIPAIAAFNAVLAANPVGVVVVALSALTAAMVAATTAIDYGTEKYEEQIEANKKLRQEIEATADAYDSQTSDIQAQNQAVSDLISRIDELMQAQGSNRDNTAQIKNVVDQLNSAVSDLNLTYDETTGTLNKTTDAIRNQTDAMFAQALQAALVDRQVEVYIQLKDAQEKLKLTQDGLAEAQSGLNDEAAGLKDAYGNTMEVMTPRAIALREEVRRLTKEEATQQKTVDGLQTNYDSLTSYITEASEATEGATARMDENADSTKSLTASVTALKDAYDTTKDSVSDAADKMSGALDRLDGKAKVSIDKITKTQDQQAQFWTDYADKLQKAKELGLDANLLADLATPTEENAQLLDSIVKGSVGKIEELNQAYADNAKARSDFAAASAAAKIEVTDLYKTFEDDMTAFVAGLNQADQAFASGSSTIAGVVNGLESELPTFEALIAHILALIAKVNGAKITLPGAVDPKYNILGFPLAEGMDRIPYDEFPARLHKDEAVLNRREADTWRALKASIISSTPSAAAMTAMPRQISAQEISGAVGSAVSSVKGGNTYNSNLTVIAPKDPSPYEIAAAQRRNFRTMVRNT